MLALYQSGRLAEALTAYQEIRRLLAEELGLDPGPELRRVHQALMTVDPDLSLAPTGPPVVAPTGSCHSFRWTPSSSLVAGRSWFGCTSFPTAAEPRW
jgi:hypothetical protein